MIATSGTLPVRGVKNPLKLRTSTNPSQLLTFRRGHPIHISSPLSKYCSLDGQTTKVTNCGDLLKGGSLLPERVKAVWASASANGGGGSFEQWGGEGATTLVRKTAALILKVLL